MPDRPNLLFIFTDQQRADTMACYGNSLIETPNLNALAAGSFVFDHAYVSSPICTPSRSTIMTGTWPHTNGCLANNIPLRADFPTIADLLPEEYLTASYRKWHLGDEVIGQHGFDEWLSMEEFYRASYTDPKHLSVMSDYHQFLIEKGITPDKEFHGAKVFSRPFAAALPEELTKASFLADRATAFIGENRDRPFALYVNILEPHPPYVGPFDEMYDPRSIPTGPTFMQAPADNAGSLARLRVEESKAGGGMDESPPGPYDEAYYRALITRYWGLVTLVDRSVGRILQALDDAGIADRTIVVFSSEHGDQLGEFNIIQKAVFYESTIRVPMLMRVPWLGDGETHVGGRYSHIDTVPTLLDLVGAPVPDRLQGESRAPVLRGEATLEGNDAIIDWTGRNSVPMHEYPELERVQSTHHRVLVSAEGWKLVLGAVGQRELYDLNSDPHEQTNLFDDPAQAGRIADMTGRISRWQQKTGDTASLGLSSDSLELR